MTIKQQGGIFGRNPTFNDVEVEGTLTATGAVSVPADSISGNAINGGTATLDGLTVDTTTFHVDSSNNRIGVGTTSPIAVVDVDMGVGGARRLLANYDDSIVSLKSSNASANPETLRLIGGNIRFNTGGSGSGSEIARVTDNGITFNGDTAAANALDDYEEGTWTPTLSVESGTAPTHTVTEARYTKIGRQVHAYAKVNISAVGAGLLRCTFPFTPDSNQGIYGNARMKNSSNNWRHTMILGYSTSFFFFGYDDNATYYVNSSTLATGDISFTLTYNV